MLGYLEACLLSRGTAKTYMYLVSEGVSHLISVLQIYQSINSTWSIFYIQEVAKHLAYFLQDQQRFFVHQYCK